jgi:sec-independent protein translocase protein TatA
MGIHWTELVVVAFVALLIFGPKRLPEIGGAVGRTYREFKKSLGEVADLTTRETTREIALPEHQGLSTTPNGDVDLADRVIRDTARSRV